MRRRALPLSNVPCPEGAVQIGWPIGMSHVFTKQNRAGFIALLLFVGVVAFVIYWRTSVEDMPGDYDVRQGNYRLEDGQYEQAIAAFQQALERNPRHALAYLGLAVTFLRLDRFEESLASFHQAIKLDPANAVAYADRGILYDRAGNHADALRDYRQALELDPDLAKGPGWLWRFLHNVHDKPPSIADRAAYLEAELAKSPQDRLLQVPELDQQQRMYKY
jgi:tetratricopeptide (TPR) repeat protein